MFLVEAHGSRILFPHREPEHVAAPLLRLSDALLEQHDAGSPAVQSAIDVDSPQLGGVVTINEVRRLPADEHGIPDRVSVAVFEDPRSAVWFRDLRSLSLRVERLREVVAHVFGGVVRGEGLLEECGAERRERRSVVQVGSTQANGWISHM